LHIPYFILVLQVGGYYLPFVVTGSLLVICAILLQLALPEIGQYILFTTTIGGTARGTIPFRGVNEFRYVVIIPLSFLFAVESESQTQNFLRLMKIPGVSLLSLHCLTASVAMTYLDPTLSDWATKKVCHPFLYSSCGTKAEFRVPLADNRSDPISPDLIDDIKPPV